jgi:DNA-binding response OmpR family regulator
MCIISDRLRYFHPPYSHKILYVGNDLNLLKLMQQILLNCQTIRCPIGSVAKLFIEKIKYSLLLFDDKLPDSTGIELAKFTRSMLQMRQTPIIILSEGKFKVEDVIFNKPSEFERLIRIITKLLET